MVTAWVVVIEADERGGTPIGVSTVRRLMERMADAHPTTLYTPDRYALQVLVSAHDPAEALHRALTLWREAATELGCGDWELVRAEVIEPAELERERNSRQVSTPEARDDDSLGDDRAAEEAVLRHIFHDSLTGIANGELFRDHLEHVLRRAARKQTTHAVLVCHVDVRSTNQWLDGALEDQTLIAVVDRLAALIRPEDSLGRIGRHEFVVLLEDSTTSLAVDVAERILQRFELPVVIGTEPMTIAATIGIAVSEAGQDAECLLHQAQSAVAAARREGPGHRSLFTADSHGAEVTQPPEPPVRRPQTVAMLELLQEAATAARECLTLEEAAASVLQQVCTHTGWPLGHLYVPGAGGRELIPSRVWSCPGGEGFASLRNLIDMSRVPAGMGLAGLALSSGAPAWTPVLASEPPDPRTQAAVEAGMSAGFAFPVLVEHQVAAVLEFFSDTPVDVDHVFWDVMSTVCDQLGRVVERTWARAAVCQSEARFAALVESSGDMVTIIEADGTLRLHLGGAMLGFPPGTKLWKSIWEAVHPDDCERAAEFLADLLRRPGLGAPIQIRLGHADGSWRSAEVVGNNLLDRPEVAGVVLLSRDISHHGAEAHRQAQSQRSGPPAESVGGGDGPDSPPALERAWCSAVLDHVFTCEATTHELASFLAIVHPTDGVPLEEQPAHPAQGDVSEQHRHWLTP